MSAASTPDRRRLSGPDRAYLAAVLAMAGLAARNAVNNAVGWASPSTDTPYVDFNALYLAGRLAAEGRLGEAYDWTRMAALEKAESLRDAAFLPFSYPPPFALAMAGFARLPIWAAYALFLLLGLALFAAVLRRFAGARLWPVAAAVGPAVYVNLVTGQNGLALGALAGLSAAMALRGRSAAAGGIAGAIAAAKPQVAVALPLLFALRRDRRALAAAAVAAAALLGLSVAALGPGIVPQFLAGMAETGRGLASGLYPLYRMTSVYACLRGLGAPASLAMTIHIAGAAAALAAATVVARRSGDPRTAAGLSLMATGFVSPYFYDYDTTVPGLGLALVLPALARSGEAWRTAVPLLALSLATTAGVLQVDVASPVPLGAPLMVVCLASALSTLSGLRVAPPELAAAPA